MTSRTSRRLAIALLAPAMGSCTSANDDLTGVDGPNGAIQVAIIAPSADSQIAVLLRGPEGFPPRGSAISVGGTSMFTDLEPGVYSVSATIFGFDCLPVSVNVQAGKTTSADIACTRKVVVAQTGIFIGIVTAGVSPVGSASVELTGSGVRHVRQTSTNGDVSFVGLKSGEYTLTTSHDHFTCPVQTIIVEIQQTTRATISCSANPTGWIAGTVVHYNDTGWPVFDAVVRVDGPTVGTALAPNGSFTFRGLQPGTYMVSASSPLTNCPATSIEVEAARTTTVQISCAFSGPSGTRIAGVWDFHRFPESQVGTCPDLLPNNGEGSLTFDSSTNRMEFVGLDPALTIRGTYDQESGSFVGTGTAVFGDGSSIQSEVFLEFQWYWDEWWFYDLPGFTMDVTHRNGWTRRHRDPGGNVICTEVYTAVGGMREYPP